MPNKCSPQTLFVFKTYCQSACGLSESLFSWPIESHSGLEQNYFILGRTERDRCTDGPSQIWILKTVVSVPSPPPEHPWSLFPLLHPILWLECDLPLVRLGVRLPSPFRVGVVLKGGHMRLWLDRKARDLRERRLGCISWERNWGKETRSDLTGECVAVYTMGEMGRDSLH